MRKFILLSSFMFCAAAGYSQFVVFGAKAGLNLATFTGNNVDNAKLHPSFHAGGFANFLVTERFFVQPELLYSGKGAKYDGGSYNLGYINVPVLVQYKSETGFFIETGPQIGFLLSAKRQKVDIKNEMKSTDYSWLVGLGYKSSMGIGAAARYDFGFFNVYNAGIVRNKTIMVSIFYTFGSGEE